MRAGTLTGRSLDSSTDQRKISFNGRYGVEHTTTVFLVAKNGTVVGPFDVQRPLEDAAAALRQFF
jgi:hypothetical protein